MEIITLLSVLPTLADDEDTTSVAAAVWFESSSYTVHEDSGNVTVRIRANFPAGLPPGEVSFTTVDGSAIGRKPHIVDYFITTLSVSAIVDYIATNYSDSFEVGVMEFTITIVDDSLAELQEVFNCSLSLVGQSNIQISQETAVIHIIDNDG